MVAVWLVGLVLWMVQPARARGQRERWAMRLVLAVSQAPVKLAIWLGLFDPPVPQSPLITNPSNPQLNKEGSIAGDRRRKFHRSVNKMSPAEFYAIYAGNKKFPDRIRLGIGLTLEETIYVIEEHYAHLLRVESIILEHRHKTHVRRSAIVIVLLFVIVISMLFGHSVVVRRRW